MDSSVRRRRGDGDTSADDIREEQRDAALVAQSSHGWGAFVLAFTAAGILLGIIIAVLPSPIQPVAFSLPPPPQWTGALTPNDKLSQAEKVLENQVRGPESIVRDGDYLYTGTADGRVVSIYRGELNTLTRLGEGNNCGEFESEPACGRPLGMRLDKEGYLLVADAYLGIFRVNVATGDHSLLVSSKIPIAGHLPRFLNDVEEGPDGLVYFTDSSTRWDRRHNRYCILEADMSGRLVSYDPKSGAVEQLAGGFAFANGMSLSLDKMHILVAETIKARIMRYHLSGPNKGQTDVFADNLPGWPDNIRQSGRGTYWVGLASVRRADKFSFLDWVAPWPSIRALIAKLVSQEAMMSMIPKYGLLIELDAQGQIIRSLHDPSGQVVPAVSEADEKDGVLYLGSYYLPYLSRLYLHRA